MKAARLLRWSGSVLSPRTRPEFPLPPCAIHIFSRTAASSAATVEDAADNFIPEDALTNLPSPPVQASRTSAKLAALHSRLNLPSRLPIETLARTLVDASADPTTQFNNQSFSVLGADLLGYYTSEYILCQYPRLPLAVVFAAMYAYCGPKALTAMTREWGVQSAAEPGGEVDPGYLQFKHVPPQPQPERLHPDLITTQPDPSLSDSDSRSRVAFSRRTIYADEFGELKKEFGPETSPLQGVTLEKASSGFVRAVIGAVYLHAGRSAAKQFYRDHFMSRSLNVAKLFQFRLPSRDLKRLCAREGFQAPVARIESETGRLSKAPVFIVGVYSGNEKLGEGAGSSLDEARDRAAVAALKGWYLYSPLGWRLPSETEEPNARPWIPAMVDAGDVVV